MSDTAKTLSQVIAQLKKQNNKMENHILQLRKEADRLEEGLLVNRAKLSEILKEARDEA